MPRFTPKRLAVVNASSAALKQGDPRVAGLPRVFCKSCAEAHASGQG